MRLTPRIDVHSLRLWLTRPLPNEPESIKYQSAVSENAIICRCSHSLAAICAAFASIAVAALLAEDACVDLGGRISDVAWACELATGISQPLWSHVSIAGWGLVLLVIGVPVYLIVNSIGRRWILALGRKRG